MRLYLFSVFIGVLLLGCGQSTQTETLTRGSPTPSPAQSSGMCLGNCSTPNEALLDFRDVYEVSEANCDVKDIQAINGRSGLESYYLASCGGPVQVYRFSSNGNQTKVTNCSALGGVQSFAVAQSETDAFVAYTCEVQTRIVDLMLKNLSTNGAPIKVDTIQNLTPQITLTFNGIGKQLGLAWPGSFKRFSSGGVQIGGSLKVSDNQSNQVNVTISKNGTWQLLATTNSSSQCSKVNSFGTLECNGKAIAESGLAYPVLTARGNLIGIDVWSYRFISRTFQADTCTDSALATAQFRSEAFEKILGAAAVSEKLTAVLGISRSKKIVVGVFDDSNGFSMVNEVVIADFDSKATAQILKVGNEIVVSYSKDGIARISKTQLLVTK